MPVPDPDHAGASVGDGSFATTHWSVVLTAGNNLAGAALPALEKLCQTYWFPVYSFARRLGHGPEDAEDLTQGFFAYFLETGLAAKAQPNRGRFRSFLLAAFKYYRAGEWDRARAQRRGGGLHFISWEQHSAEQRYGQEPVDDKDPESCYERNWAMALLDAVLLRLEAEFTSSRKETLFHTLKLCLIGSPREQTYQELASSLGKTESAIKEAVRRMRLRYRELFREEVAQTVSSQDELEDEIRRLVTILRA